MSLWANSPQVGYEAFAIPSAMEAIKAGRRIVVSSDNAAEVGRSAAAIVWSPTICRRFAHFLRGRHRFRRLSPRRLLGMNATKICSMLSASSRATSAGDCGRRWSQSAPDRPARDRKTMLASRLPGLLPPLSNREALESAAIQSLVNLHTAKTRWRQSRSAPPP